MELTTPLPCANAAGLAHSAEKSTLGPETVLAVELLSLEPSVLPVPENEALDLVGPRAALAAAERMAVRRAVGLAPRTVSTTVLPLRTRNVGILCFALR